jgi:hypothetical protein
VKLQLIAKIFFGTLVKFLCLCQFIFAAKTFAQTVQDSTDACTIPAAAVEPHLLTERKK